MTDEAARVAAMLTPAECDAVQGIYSYSSPWEEEEGDAKLYQLGIWNPRPKWGHSAITPLGLAVRAYLESRND